MKLLVDMGNSRLKWAWATDQGFAQGGALSYRDRLEADLDWEWGARAVPERVIIASVARERASRVVAGWASRRWRIEAEFLRAQASAHGVTNAYHEPAQLGVDRWMAVLAAHASAPDGSACVVDCGSAVTLDAVSADGRHLGGAILPGLQLMRGALAAGTSLLPEVGESPIQLPAASTVGAIAGGTLLGLAKMIDGLVGALCRERRYSALYLTGGDAVRLLPHLERDYLHRPDLVLEGMELHARGAP